MARPPLCRCAGYAREVNAGLVHLKGLSQLRGLRLPGTKVTDAGVAKLKQALPNVTVPPEDLFFPRQQPLPPARDPRGGRLDAKHPPRHGLPP